MNEIENSNYLALAEKFNEARWGHGPGISQEDLAMIGLKRPKTFTSRTTGRRHPLKGWENLCCYVWEKMCEKPWPSSSAIGRGFHSQICGEHVVKLLKGLASEEDK